MVAGYFDDYDLAALIGKKYFSHTTWRVSQGKTDWLSEGF